MIHIKLARTGITPQSKNLKKRLKQAILATLDCVGLPENSELTVQLSTEEVIKKLNFKFLGVDAPTDVLAFPSGDINPETEKPYLGDVIISFSRAQKQADEGAHSIEQELELLVVHGTLHLLGFDHADEHSKSKMWLVQQQILDNLGCKINL